MNQRETALFQLNHVGYIYTAANTPSFQALKDLNLTIQHGEFVAIIGPSGSGKSTLMHILGLMTDPGEGALFINGSLASDLTANQKAGLRNKTIGFLFQQFFLLPQLTVLDNILLPSEYRQNSLSDEHLRTRAFELMERYDLKDQESKRPVNLSGGQRQRVALCRALMMDPDVLMCDEPTGALDSTTATEVLNTLQELHSAGRTIVVITHDPEVAQRAQRILRIVDGKIVSDTGTQEKNQIENSKSNSEPFTIAQPKDGSRTFSSRVSHLLKSLFVPTWQALKTQRLRTALTMIGLLIGVASIFIMLTLTGRVRKIFEDFFATQGARKAMIVFDYRLAEKTGAPRWRGLNVKTDLPRLNAQLSQLGRLDPEISTNGCAIATTSGNLKTSLSGLHSLTAAREENLRIAEGRLPMPHEFDSSHPARIALLGSDAALKLFPNVEGQRSEYSTVIGKKIVIRGCSFEGILTIVGLLKPIDTLFDRDINSTIYVPTQTLLAGGVSVFESHFSAVPNDNINPSEFAKHVIGKLTLLTQNRFPFRFFAAEQELQKFNLMMGILTGLTLMIGSLCTLIGGVGVMNIMLVNVHERVQEIGIRKSVGARDSHIRLQFLLESTGLCLISGCLGLALGLITSISAFSILRIFLPKIEGITYQPDLLPMIIALVVSVGAGLLFGTWPARRAATLDIVNALKQE